MIVLRNIKQIEDKLKEIFELKDFEYAQKFTEENFSEDFARQLISTTINLDLKIKSVEDFSEMLFQLKDYMPALNNFVMLLLISKNYNALFSFVKRIFVGQIGAIRYVSTQNSYNFVERYFDRFIEIVKNCEIDKKLYMPLIINAFESDKDNVLFNWKRPAVEYMQTFFNENEEWTYEYIKDNEDKYKILEIISDFNTVRGIKMAVDNYLISQTTEDKKSCTHILKKYRRETFLEIDKRYKNENLQNRLGLIEIIKSFGTDVEAQARLKELCAIERNEEVKKSIERFLGVLKSPSSFTLDEFIKVAHSNTPETHEKSLGLSFDKTQLVFSDGEIADNFIHTYIINLFKSTKKLEEINELKFLFNLFKKQSLSNFAEMLFEQLKEKPDIKEAKWCIRMCAMLAGDTYIKSAALFAKKLIDTGRIKEAKYLVRALIYAGRKEAIFLLAYIKNNAELEDAYSELYEVMRKNSEISFHLIMDMAVPEEDISDDMFEMQKERMFGFFINNRTFGVNYFKNFFIAHKLFGKLAEKVVWGEYKFGRLHNVFVVSGGQIEYKYKSSELEDKDIQIAIVHPLDCYNRFEGIESLIEKPLFNQFKKSRFDVFEFSASKIYVNRFCGVIINVMDFVNKLKNKGFIVNKFENENKFEEMIHINEELHLACIVKFEKATAINQLNSTLGFVTYHKISDLVFDNGKYLTFKADAIGIGGVPYRYFDYTMSSIIESYKG